MDYFAVSFRRSSASSGLADLTSGDSDQSFVDPHRVTRYRVAVEFEENEGCGSSCPLVAVDEGLGLSKMQ